MFQRQSHTVDTKRNKLSNKMIAGFAALSITAIIGAGGVAAATTPSQTGNGYGGGNTSVVDLDLTLNNSNNNVINIVLNVFR
jgi:hypothetical protein